MKIYCNKGLNTFFGNEANNMTIMSNSFQSALDIYDGLSTLSIFIENNDNTIETLKGLRVVVPNIEMFKEANEILNTGYIITVLRNGEKETCFLPSCKISIQTIEEGIKEHGISRILDLSKEDFVYVRQNPKLECNCDSCRKKVLNQNEDIKDLNQNEDTEMDLLSKTRDIAKRALILKERFSEGMSEEEEFQYFKDTMELKKEAKAIRERISSRINNIEGAIAAVNGNASSRINNIEEQKQQECKSPDNSMRGLTELINMFSQLIKKN